MSHHVIFRAGPGRRTRSLLRSSSAPPQPGRPAGATQSCTPRPGLPPAVGMVRTGSERGGRHATPDSRTSSGRITSARNDRPRKRGATPAFRGLSVTFQPRRRPTESGTAYVVSRYPITQFGNILGGAEIRQSPETQGGEAFPGSACDVHIQEDIHGSALSWSYPHGVRANITQPVSHAARSSGQAACTPRATPPPPPTRTARYRPSSTHGIAPDRVDSRTHDTGTFSRSATSFASSRRSVNGSLSAGVG